MLRAIAASTMFMGIGLLAGCSEDRPLTTEEIVERVRPSTVLVKSLQDDFPTGSGSGWVINAERGLIATNFHVVAPGQEFKVALDREGKKRDAKLVAAAPCDDIAVLKVGNISGLRSLPVSDQKELQVGEKVVTLGFPQNVSSSDQLQVTEGIVSVKRTKLKAGEGPVRGFPDHPNLIQLDAALNPGNSGGPTVNEEGALVGMNTYAGRPGQGYAIGSDRLEALLPSLGQGKSRDWAGFGFVFDGSQDLVVTSVFPDTPAERSTLAPGEVIWSLDEVTIYNMQDYCRAVRGGGTNALEARVVFDPDLVSLYSDAGIYYPKMVFNRSSRP